MNLTTLGIDLAKTSFSLVGMDERGKVILRKTLKRDALMAFVAQLKKQKRCSSNLKVKTVFA
jgi:transposase